MPILANSETLVPALDADQGVGPRPLLAALDCEIGRHFALDRPPEPGPATTHCPNRCYWVMTRKYWLFAAPGVTLKVNEPVRAALDCSEVYRFKALSASVELTRAKGWPNGPVPEMLIGLP